jgi:hypothetical protein
VSCKNVVQERHEGQESETGETKEAFETGQARSNFDTRTKCLHVCSLSVEICYALDVSRKQGIEGIKGNKE